MKTRIIITLLICSGIGLTAQDYKASNIGLQSTSLPPSECANVDGLGYGCTAYHNGKTYFYFNDIEREQKVLETQFDLNSRNEIIWNYLLNRLDRIELPLAACSFKEYIYLCTKEGDHIRYYYKNPDSNDWKDLDFYRNIVDLPNKTDRPCAMIEFKDKLYLFYIESTTGKIKYLASDDGQNWEPTYEIHVDHPASPNSGNISACKVNDSEGVSNILLTYISADKHIAVGNYYTSTGDFDLKNQRSFQDKDALNVSCIQGSTTDGNEGRIVQIFYTSKNSDLHTHNMNYFYRKEYDFQNYEFSTERTEYSQLSNTIDKNTWCPITFFDFKTIGDEGLRKQIAVSVLRTEKGILVNDFLDPRWIDYPRKTIDILVWDSEEYSYQANSDTYEQLNDPSTWTFIGVIEGPPPYVMRGWSLDPHAENSLPAWGRPITSFEYGIQNSSSQKSEFTFSAKNTTTFNIKGFIFGFGYHGSNEWYEESKETLKQTFEIEPLPGESLGYYLVLKPTILRKKYNILDAHGNVIDDFFTFKISENNLVMISYEMEESSSGLNTADMNTYMSRIYDFDRYGRIFKHGFSADILTGGFSYEIENTYGSTVSRGFTIYVGIEKEVPKIFKVKAEDEFEFDWTNEISTSSGQEISVVLKVPEKNTDIELERDTTHYEGNFYWLAPTDGMDNWWIPDHEIYGDQNPWVMTWEVTEVWSEGQFSFSPISTGIENRQLLSDGMIIYPNPVSGLFNIKFNVEKNANTSISIYDSNGRLLNNLFEKNMPAGFYEKNINIDLDPGLYFCQFRSGDKMTVKKLVINQSQGPD